MNSWKLSDLALRGSKLTAAALKRWQQHAAFFDDTVQGLQGVGWLPPMENFAARVIRETRIATQPRLILPAHVEPTNPYWPRGSPGSDEEANSYCLHFLCAAVLRSLAHSGHMAFAGLPLESIGTHRRTLETLLQIEVLLDNPKLAMPCFRAAQEMSKKKRDANPFLKRMKQVSHRIANKQQFAAGVLTELQREFRRRTDDSGLHMGPHAGIHHGLFGRLPDGTFDFFDVGSGDLGMYALRYARETLVLCNVLVLRLPWIDGNAWRSMFDALDQRCRALVAPDRKKRGISPNHECPWFSWPGEQGGVT